MSGSQEGIAFFFDRKVPFLSKKKTRLCALRQKGKCRLRDPPQAVHPAEQDAFLLYRKFRFWIRGKETLQIEHMLDLQEE